MRGKFFIRVSPEENPLYKQLLTALAHYRGRLKPAVVFPEDIIGALRAGSLTIEGIESPQKPGWKLSDSAELPKLVKTLPSTQAVADAYLTYMEDVGAAEGYRKVRARKLRFFARQHPELPTDPEIIRVYLRQFKTADVPTRQDQWKALRGLYKYAYRDKPEASPMLKVDKPRFRKKSGQRLSRDQAKALLSAIKTDLEWALATCYFALRFRRVEAERLRFGDIKSDYIVVQGKERTEELPLLPIFRDKLLKLRSNHSPNDPVFGLKADTLAYHIAQLFKRARLEGVRGSPHTLRNTAGALWSTFGGDWTSNRQLLRHSAKTMTDHYSPLTIDELRVKDERHNPMLNLMRQLGLAPALDYQNTTGVLVSEAEGYCDTNVLINLLDNAIDLGHLAHELRHALGNNGHRPKQLKEITQYLEHQAENKLGALSLQQRPTSQNQNLAHFPGF